MYAKKRLLFAPVKLLFKDERRYKGWPAIVRAVNAKNAMTATIEEIPREILHKVTYRFTYEVKGINRVLMDLSPNCWHNRTGINPAYF